MIKIEKIRTYGWDAAIRGMRNPMNSWDKSDSFTCKENEGTCLETCPFYGKCDLDNPLEFVVGKKDNRLMEALCRAGTDHRKFMRMIAVYMDITAPMYWWKEFDTYKVGTVANSCSTMHTIHKKAFTLDDFSHDHLIDASIEVFEAFIEYLNVCRMAFVNDNDKEYWWQMIQLLPSSYNQKRTVMLNYEVLANIYKSRRSHKLDEWGDFCRIIALHLPYSRLITHDSQGE